MLRLFRRTPPLSARLLIFHVKAEEALAPAIEEERPVDPRGAFAAGRRRALPRTPQVRNARRVRHGQSADGACPDAAAAARTGFVLLAGGLAGCLTR